MIRSRSVLFVFKHAQAENPSACHVGMGVTACNAALSLREARIPADFFPVRNGEFLWQKLNGEWSKYTHVILCAPYIDATFLRKLVRAFPEKHFALVYHSNLGFLAVDRFAARSLSEFLKLEQECANFVTASNSEELANAITEATGRTLTHLPNLYHLPHTTRRLRERWAPGMVLHVGLFGAARVLKNWLTAAAATMILQRALEAEVHLHVSTGRDEGAAGTRESLSDLLSLNPSVRLVEVPWLSVDDFRRYLYGMDLLLQPSFTETFNNVTADGCACGVPTIVSDAIDWAPGEWVAKADSATAIAEAACRVLRDKRAARKGWEALDRYNRGALAAWLNWLEPPPPPWLPRWLDSGQASQNL